ncbi:MAG: dynamin family protein [Verrucomicrobiota bacterium]|nr:dynamin family protein [Verrucomicrobiota bacterium]
MDDLLKLERNVRSTYAKTLSLLASRFHYPLPISDRDVPGLPRVLFLGNHSSGKSSFINHIAGIEIQKSGLAPTDDGFTLVTYGDVEETLDGQTVVTHPDLDYQDMADLGPEFLVKLQYKTYPAEVLRHLTLIDSPGMIDSASDGQHRGYDFSECVKRFADSADLILFFFDPDKPGTTGEAISTFTEQLVGLEHKLLIILNKVDLFDHIRDFARTYGTLCWNLSKTIPSKDTPRIYTTYLPDFATGQVDQKHTIPLEDFDAAREEVIAEVKRAPARRADNLVSGLLIQAKRLSVHARVCHEVASYYNRLVSKIRFGICSALFVVGGSFWLTRLWWFKEEWVTAFNEENWESLTTPGFIAAALILLAFVFLWACSIGLQKIRKSISTEESLDVFFKRAYKGELSLRKRADLFSIWQATKPGVLDVIDTYGLRSLSTSSSSRKLLRNLQQSIEKDIPALRRKVDFTSTVNSDENEGDTDIEDSNETSSSAETPHEESRSISGE